MLSRNIWLFIVFKVLPSFFLFILQVILILTVAQLMRNRPDMGYHNMDKRYWHLDEWKRSYRMQYTRNTAFSAHLTSQCSLSQWLFLCCRASISKSLVETVQCTQKLTSKVEKKISPLILMTHGEATCFENTFYLLLIQQCGLIQL